PLPAPNHGRELVTAHTARRGRLGPASNTISVVDSHPLASQLRTLLHELTHAVDPVTEEPGWVRAERKRKAGHCSGSCLDVSRVLT
ncbi:MAG TPA: hypothetical protein VIV12_24190, partial [Streptosporangiaceae bacterium]